MPRRNCLRTPLGRVFVLYPAAMALCLVAMLLSFAPPLARAQNDDQQHGRKYKAPPATSNIEVTVLKTFNNKPVMNAAVVFHPVKDGRDEGNLEMKTGPDGKASIDIIPTGSLVTIQVIADGFATFAQDYQIDQPSRQILIKLIRPRAQLSGFVDNSGKPAQMQPGEQVPVRPKTATSPAPSSSGQGPAQQP